MFNIDCVTGLTTQTTL